MLRLRFIFRWAWTCWHLQKAQLALFLFDFFICLKLYFFRTCIYLLPQVRTDVWESFDTQITTLFISKIILIDSWALKLNGYLAILIWIMELVIKLNSVLTLDSQADSALNAWSPRHVYAFKIDLILLAFFLYDIQLNWTYFHLIWEIAILHLDWTVFSRWCFFVSWPFSLGYLLPLRTAN